MLSPVIFALPVIKVIYLYRARFYGIQNTGRLRLDFGNSLDLRLEHSLYKFRVEFWGNSLGLDFEK